MEALTRLPAVTIEGTEYPTYRNERGEEVMQDLDIGRALELARPRNIRKLIAAHSDELGDVRSRQERTPGQDGPAFDVYYLTEAQALYIAAKCRTKAAAAQLKRLIAVYMAARAGNGAAAVALAQRPDEPRFTGGDSSGDLLIASMQHTLALAQRLQAMKAEQEQLAMQQSELARQQTMQAVKVDEQGAKVDQLLAAQQAAEVALRAPLGPVMQLPPLSRRAETNRIGRDYCQATGDYRGGWNRLFREHRDRFHVDLKARAKIRGVTPAVIAEELGRWDHLHALAVELFCKGERVFHA